MAKKRRQLDGGMLEGGEGRMAAAASLPENRVPACKVIESVIKCLDEATKVETKGDAIPFDAPCGICRYDEDQQCWQVLHRPMRSSSGMGVLVDSSIAPTSSSAPVSVVARLKTTTSDPPPEKLVRLLLRRAELRNMLQQVQILPGTATLENLTLPCRTQEELNLAPMLDGLCGDLAPSRECVTDALCFAVTLCSSCDDLEEFPGWDVELLLGSGDENQNGQNEYLKAVQKLVGLCLAMIDTDDPCEGGNQETTGKKRSDGDWDGENGCSRPNQSAKAAEPDKSSEAQSRASREDVPEPENDEAGESRPAKRARRHDPKKPAFHGGGASGTAKSAELPAVDGGGATGTAKSKSAELPAVDGSGATGIAKSADHTRTTRSKAAATTTSSGITAAENKSASRMRTRQTAQQDSAAEKPRATRAAASTTASTSGSTMNLRKRNVAALDSHPEGYGTSSARSGDVHIPGVLRRCMEVGECEVCLQPYALSYLSKHRNKVHALAHNLFGCPYCPETFSTTSERVSHIKGTHTGQPWKWSLDGCDNMSNVKAQVYSCPLCPTQFSLNGIACHLSSSHQKSVSSFQGRIYMTCPFCMTSTTDGKQLGRYKSFDDLRAHVSAKHKGCFLLDDVKVPFDPTSASRYVKRTESETNRPPSPAPTQTFMDEEPLAGEEDDASSVQDADQQWGQLDYTLLVSDYSYGDFIPTSFGNTLASAIEAVDAQLESLESHKVTDDDHTAELKLYNRGLKERQQKADAERIEKERHKEEVERKLLQLQYKNRHKKKRTPEEIEYDHFLSRPIVLAPPRASARQSKCALGDQCELCVSGIKEPETDASGRLIDAPSIHVKTVKDSGNHVAEQAEVGDQEGSASRPRRRGRTLNTTSRSMLMLQEMKHSFQFIESYNKGYFKR